MFATVLKRHYELASWGWCNQQLQIADCRLPIDGLMIDGLAIDGLAIGD